MSRIDQLSVINRIEKELMDNAFFASPQYKQFKKLSSAKKEEALKTDIELMNNLQNSFLSPVPHHVFHTTSPFIKFEKVAKSDGSINLSMNSPEKSKESLKALLDNYSSGIFIKEYSEDLHNVVGNILEDHGFNTEELMRGNTKGSMLQDDALGSIASLGYGNFSTYFSQQGIYVEPRTIRGRTKGLAYDEAEIQKLAKRVPFGKKAIRYDSITMDVDPSNDRFNLVMGTLDGTYNGTQRHSGTKYFPITYRARSLNTPTSLLERLFNPSATTLQGTDIYEYKMYHNYGHRYAFNDILLYGDRKAGIYGLNDYISAATAVGSTYADTGVGYYDYVAAQGTGQVLESRIIESTAVSFEGTTIVQQLLYHMRVVQVPDEGLRASVEELWFPEFWKSIFETTYVGIYGFGQANALTGGTHGKLLIDAFKDHPALSKLKIKFLPKISEVMAIHRPAEVELDQPLLVCAKTDEVHYLKNRQDSAYASQANMDMISGFSGVQQLFPGVINILKLSIPGTLLSDVPSGYVYPTWVAQAATGTAS